MKNFLNKKGFTMAEMLVCLAIISVIATILIPTLVRVKPNKEKAMFKKTYSVAERIVYELVNDPELYPPSDSYVGFDNVKEVTYNGTTYGSDSVNEDAAKQKFCKLFAMKLNTVGPNDDGVFCSSTNANIENTPSFTTTDGVEWHMPISNFVDGNNISTESILVDVNGKKGPNNQDTSGSECNENVDRFEIKVRADGKMWVEGACAEEYISAPNIAN